MKEGINLDEKIKENTRALLQRHDESGENFENYSYFFEKCTNGIISYFNKKLTEFKEQGLSAEEAQTALFKTLNSKESIQNMVSNISPNPTYLINETTLSNRVAEVVLSAILQADDVLLAMKHDAKANSKMETFRCLITAPCELTHSDGEKDHVVFVALSGHADAEENLSLFQLHQKIKAVVDNLQYYDPEHGEFYFRYIEKSSRRYDVILQQINSCINKSEIENTEIQLSNEASKGCAEKKIFSELAKQLMSLKSQGFLKLFVTGMTNICLPGYNYLENPAAIHALEARKKELSESNKYKKEQSELNECQNALANTLANIEKCEVSLQAASSKKQQKKLSGNLERLNTKLIELRKREETLQKKLELVQKTAALSDHAEEVSTDNVIYIPTKEDPTKYWPCWKIEACSMCQSHKISYTVTSYQSSYMPSSALQRSPQFGPSNAAAASMFKSPTKSGPSTLPGTPVSERSHREPFFTPSMPLSPLSSSSTSFVSPQIKISPAQTNLRRREPPPEKRRRLDYSPT